MTTLLMNRSEWYSVHLNRSKRWPSLYTMTLSIFLDGYDSELGTCLRTKNSPSSVICFGGSPAFKTPHQTVESSSASGTPTTLSANADVTSTGDVSVPNGASNHAS